MSVGAVLLFDRTDEVGGLVHRLSSALGQVTGCVKTYLMKFSEAEGFAHPHVRVVPRMPDHPGEARGPKVFASLNDNPAQWLPESQRDSIALALRTALS